MPHQVRQAFRAFIVLTLATAVRPAVSQAQIAVMSSTVEEKIAAIGTRYTGNIIISNPDKQAATARIYQTDYHFSYDGTSTFDDPGSTPRSNAKWITPQATRVTIPPGAQVTVPYTVVIPADDSLKGTYWSTVMVEGAPAEPKADTVGGKVTMTVGSVMRYAIQIATHIQSTGTRTVRFENFAATKNAAGSSLVDVQVYDAGERGYRPELWIEVYDAQGVMRGKGKQSRGLLFPGTSLLQHFDLGVLPPGTYKAILFADTGADEIFATQYTITV